MAHSRPAHGWARTLVVTVSVEPDDPAVVGSTGNYRCAEGVVRFHEVCRAHGVRPTYLLTWSAASRRELSDLFRALADGAEAEVGAHLHPEEVPPMTEHEREAHTLRPSQVEPQRLRAKLRNLVEKIREATGRRPTSYRSGFMDLDPNQVAALVGLGIEADSSLGPLERVRRRYPFVGAPLEPYLLDPDAPWRPAREDGRLVEVPMTSVFRQPFPAFLQRLYCRLPGKLRGALRRLGLAEIISLRPAGACAEELLAACRRTEALGVPAVMTIHSNELTPGTSATVPDAAACSAYFERLERVFALVSQEGWATATLTGVARTFLGRPLDHASEGPSR